MIISIKKFLKKLTIKEYIIHALVLIILSFAIEQAWNVSGWISRMYALFICMLVGIILGKLIVYLKRV